MNRQQVLYLWLAEGAMIPAQSPGRSTTERRAKVRGCHCEPPFANGVAANGWFLLRLRPYVTHLVLNTVQVILTNLYLWDH